MGVTGTWTSLTAAAYAQDSLTEYAGDVVRAQVTPIVIGVLSAILACVVYDLVKRRKWTSIQGVAMQVINRRRRKRWCRSFAAWLITEAFEEALYKERWTREEVDELYQIIGSRCDMKELLPAKGRMQFPSLEEMKELKEAIRKRIKFKKPPSLKSILFNR